LLQPPGEAGDLGLVDGIAVVVNEEQGDVGAPPELGLGDERRAAPPGPHHRHAVGMTLAPGQQAAADGQQRLAAIYEFFANELPLSPDSVAQFGGPYYKELKSKYSDACSRSTDGANGRNDSRNLILRFKTDCISRDRGSPTMLRAPRARGPNSIRP